TKDECSKTFMTNFLFVVFKLEILKEIAILKRDRHRIFHENSYYFRYLFKKVKFCYACLV
ncbi:hypothetical protein, partial [Enterococcus faecalis]